MVGAARRKHEDFHSEIHFVEFPKNDVKWCAISLADVVKTGNRLEAAVYGIKGKQARDALQNCKYDKLPLYGNETGFSDAYTCGRFKRIWVKYSDLPIYQPSAITDIKPQAENFLSSKTNTDIEKLRVHKGQILITCSGTIGKVTLVSNTLDNKIFSHDLIRLTPKNSVDIGLIYAFLRSDIGNTILQTNRYGSVIQHIEPEHLADVKIPNPPAKIKNRINDLILKSFALRDESNELIDRATELLIEALKLPSIAEFKTVKFDKTKDIDNFIVKLSNLNGRVDASFHTPLANAIIAHLKAHSAELTNVGDKRVSKDIILPGRFKRVYVEEGQGRVFFGGKQLGELDPSGKKYLSLVHHGERIKKQLELHENMTMVTSSGTIGKVALVPKHWENWTANQHIIRIVPTSIDIAGYLSIFLASDYGYSLITKHTYGSVVDEIDANHVSQIPFPLLKDKSIQDEINSLALLANKKRYDAYVAEQDAMKIVNDEVIYAT